MRIAYCFASRQRPERFFSAFENIRSASASKDYFIWAKLDTDDPTMNNPKVIEKIKNEYPEVTVRWGLSKNKIHAINRDLEDLPPCDIVIIMSDDIVFEGFGFDNEIREAFKKHFPNLDGTIHYPEDHIKSRIIIVSILGANLYKKLGYLYHPYYISVYGDNDFTEMTKLMGKYVFIDKRIFSHHHPIWKMIEWDDLYKKNENPEYYQKDKETFSKILHSSIVVEPYWVPVSMQWVSPNESLSLISSFAIKVSPSNALFMYNYSK